MRQTKHRRGNKFTYGKNIYVCVADGDLLTNESYVILLRTGRDKQNTDGEISLHIAKILI